MARRKQNVPVAKPTAPDIIRFPLGGSGTIPLPELAVVLGACVVPAPGQENGMASKASKAAKAAWKTIIESGTVVLVGGQPMLECLADDAVAPGAADAMPHRSDNEIPFVVTPREGGIEVESYLFRGNGRQVKAPAGWEVWVWIAR